MTTKKTLTFILLMVFVLTTSEVLLFAARGTQVDLVEIKKKEEERRKKTKKSKQNFTDKDLEPIKKEKTNITESSPGDPDENTDPGEINAAAATPKKDEKTPTDPKQTEKYWKDRVKAIKANIKQNQDVIKQEEEKLAKLNTDYFLKPDERLQIEQERQNTFTRIENYKRGIENLEKDLEALETEARKAAIPAGWLRD